MKIDISYKNITPDNPLEIFVADKLGALDKMLGDKGELRLEIGKPSLHHRHGEVFYAEANLKLGGILLRAESTQEDLRTAIVHVKNELQLQIKKLKDKKETLSRKTIE
jgi:ribosomal subunit interface protein